VKDTEEHEKGWPFEEPVGRPDAFLAFSYLAQKQYELLWDRIDLDVAHYDDFTLAECNCAIEALKTPQTAEGACFLAFHVLANANDDGSLLEQGATLALEAHVVNARGRLVKHRKKLPTVASPEFDEALQKYLAASWVIDRFLAWLYLRKSLRKQG
jgi:hypothetical protein